jgi:hypothetical protein
MGGSSEFFENPNKIFGKSSQLRFISFLKHLYKYDCTYNLGMNLSRK